MYAFLIVIHVLVCIFLIAVILLQAGRGGGFSELAGGSASQAQSIFGTQTSVFMTRTTEVCAVVFILTSLSLGFISAQKGKSLVEKGMLNEALKRTAKTLPQIPNGTETKAADVTTKAVSDTVAAAPKAVAPAAAAPSAAKETTAASK